MKTKMVMTVQMKCEKCRKKAKEIAAGAAGVDSVSVEGAEREKVIVVGENIDVVSIVTLMRKKVGHTVLIAVEDVKPKPAVGSEQPSAKPPQSTPIIYSSFPQFVGFEMVPEEYPSPSCSLM